MPTVEVAVIGSGMAGAAVGARLAAAGRSHIVLEAGPDQGAVHIGSSLDTAHLSDPTRDPDFTPFAVAGDVYGPHTGLRRRRGGRSLYWRGICLRIEPPALADWPNPVAATLTRQYDEVEAELSAWTGRRDLAAARTDTERRIVDRLTTAGYRAAPTPRAVRVLPDGGWAAYTPLAARPGPIVAAQWPVRKLRQHKSGFELISAKDDHFIARHVVLAAGVFANVALLAKLLGGTVFHTTVFDHVASGVLALQPGDRDDCERMDSSVCAGFDAVAASNTMVECRQDPAGVLWDVWAMGEQPPHAGMRLGVDGAAVTVNLGTVHRAAITEVYRAQRATVAAVVDALGIPLLEQSPVSFAQASALARRYPATAVRYQVPLGELDHESGGLPLGGRDVDDRGRVRAVPGLSVAGPCLFPRTGAANPTLTTLALAAHLADEFA